MYDEKKWMDIAAHVDFAFQPIVNIHTGDCIGYEALLRKYESFGFRTPNEVFDSAYAEQSLYQFDLLLREKAIKKFVSIGRSRQCKLFYNLDNRLLDSPNYSTGNTIEILAAYNLSASAVCFEISEWNKIKYTSDLIKTFNMYRLQQFKIAIDDFGAGYSGLKLLYNSEPDFIKIDRFFITGISHDSRKALFVSKIVSIAHLIGIYVIAEGLESKEEHYTCKEIGCDFTQGFYVQRPVTDITLLQEKYKNVAQLTLNDRRQKTSDKRIIFAQMEEMPAISITSDMQTVFETFRENEGYHFFPVINESGEPIGLIHEKDIKKYVYSRFGKELLTNPYTGKKLRDFVIRSPIASVATTVEEILEIFNLHKNAEGVLIVQNMRYIGFLSAKSLLAVLNDKNIAIARDQNPLTHLAGNHIISEYISKALLNRDSQFICVYFDLDNFKPFNDKYGFREGDRVILLFADILHKKTCCNNSFIGHIGGDDFFAAFENIGYEDAREIVVTIIEQFRIDVEIFYEGKDRENGFILSKDREGNIKKIPLLTVSAVVLQIDQGHKNYSIGEITSAIASMKKTAKSSPDKICAASIWRNKNDFNYIEKIQEGAICNENQHFC